MAVQHILTEFIFAKKMSSPQNVIKLNPSQELRLRKSVQQLQGVERAGVQQHQGVERAAGGIISCGVFATPLLCPITIGHPTINLSREEFLSIKKFSIYKMQNAGGVYFFPCALELPQHTNSFERAAFICCVSVQQFQGVQGTGVQQPQGVQGAGVQQPQGVQGAGVQQPQGVQGAARGTQNNNGQRFSLQGFLEKAGGIIAAAPQAFWAEENFFFNATSFKMCRMEINANSYKLYDEVWKKV